MFLSAGFLSAGQTSDYTGAAALLSSLPAAKVLLADRGYDADWFRDALSDRGIEACIPAKSNRKIHIPHDKACYRNRHNLLGYEDMPCQATDRKYVRQTQRLATYPHALRQLRGRVHVRHRPRSRRNLLVVRNEA